MSTKTVEYIKKYVSPENLVEIKYINAYNETKSLYFLRIYSIITPQQARKLSYKKILLYCSLNFSEVATFIKETNHEEMVRVLGKLDKISNAHLNGYFKN